jgi:hypothetical protein
MLKTLALAGLFMLFGASVGNAQYRDSAPPDDQRDGQYNAPNDAESNDSYDEELLGPRNHGYDNRGYDEPNIDVGIFANLGNDGRWYFAGNIGWVWRPYADAGWRPYTNGHWVWTSYGWTWVSYEPFGWATYHYGYWTCDAQLGWVWIPGYDWSPCRVQWAYYDNYICWAPLYPPGYACPRPFTTAGFNIWFTIGASHFCDPYPANYYVRPRYQPAYAERIAFKSPDRRFVEQYSGRPVRTATVEFKHRSFSRDESRTATRSVERDRVTMKSRPFTPETRTWNSPSTNRQGNVYKAAPRAQDPRSFGAQEPRVAHSSVKSYREGRALDMQQPARPQVREQRMVRQPRREQQGAREFRPAPQAQQEKNIRQPHGSEKRDVAKSPRAGKNFDRGRK